MDGVYQGMYLLTDKIDISSDMLNIGNLDKETRELNSLPVEDYSDYTIVSEGEISLRGWNLEAEPSDISGGYLLEMEYAQRYAAEPSIFKTKKEQYVVIKSPQYASVNEATYISEYVQEFEDALYAEGGVNEKGKSWLDYIDLDSFAKRYVLDEISKNIDAGYASTYFYKPQYDEKLYAGPVWDYDLSLANAGGWGEAEMLNDPEGLYINKRERGWYAPLYEKPEFYQKVREVYSGEFSGYLDALLDVEIDRYEEYISASAQMDNACWCKDDWEEEIRRLKEFLQIRKEFLDDTWKMP